MIVCVIALAFAMPTVLAESKTTVAPTIPSIETLPGPDSKMKLEDTSDYLTKNLLPNIAKTVTGLAITLSVIFIIFGAIQLLTAYGNEEKLGNAKKTIMFALVGLGISLLSFAIVQIIFFTGFQVTQIK